MNVEFIDEAAAWFDRLLADAGHAVVADHVFKAMPVDGAWLGQVVVEDYADVIALVDLDGRARSAAVESPDVDGFVGVDFLAEDFRDQVVDLGGAVHGVGEVANIGGYYGGLCVEGGMAWVAWEWCLRRRRGSRRRHGHLHLHGLGG